MSTITYTSETNIGSGRIIPAHLLTPGNRVQYASEIFLILEVKRWGDKEIVLTCKSPDGPAVIYLQRYEEIRILN